MCRFLAMCVASVLVGAAAEAATLKPVAVETCFVAPGSPATIRWKVRSGPVSGNMEYVIRDYAGKQSGTGQAKPSGTDTIETALNLPQGFYEIEFPATKQRFGIVALPPWKEKPDPFFAIDGALSWLVKDDAVREGLIRVAGRSGIGMVRERLSWGAVHPAADRWDWETPAKFESLRRAYAKHSVGVLEMAHDGPAWMGRVSVYPQDLAAVARSWQAIAAHWRPTWGALEIWNEPDISFGGNLPADQYVPLAKAIAYGLHDKTDVPLVGGVMAHCNREFLDAAAENGLLDCIDAFSFHTYGRAMEMEGLVARYREWLAAHDKASPTHYRSLRVFPLWITECGRPWKKGPQRPPADQDAESALDITMKGVEARACGIARYFPFVYPYYEENENNFGMMDKEGTPLRSMAAYAQMVRALSFSRYVGDLNHFDPAIKRARLFDNGQQHVAVLYTGKADPDCSVRLGLPPLCLSGIDGRVLDLAADGAIPVPDGLTYVWLDRSRVGDRLITGAPAMQLYWLRRDPATRFAPSSIIMRYLYDPALVEPTSEGYRIKANPAGRMPFAVRVFNFSAEEWRLKLALDLQAEDRSVSLGYSPPLTVAPRSSTDATWDADFTEMVAARGEVKATVVTNLAFSGAPKDRLVVQFRGERDLVPTLQGFQHWVRLPIQQSARWTPNVVGLGKMQMDSTPEAAWRLQVTFGQGDRWVYPFFKLPDTLRLNEHTALIIRARCHKPAEVRVFLWEGDTGVGYITPNSIIPTDGQWHVAVVRFQDLILSGANAPDPNGRLDLDQVRRISIGMNSRADENRLEVSDVCVGADKP